MAAKTGNTYIYGTMTERIQNPTGNLEFLTTVCSTKCVKTIATMTDTRKEVELQLAALANLSISGCPSISSSPCRIIRVDDDDVGIRSRPRSAAVGDNADCTALIRTDHDRYRPSHRVGAWQFACSQSQCFFFHFIRQMALTYGRARGGKPVSLRVHDRCTV